MKQAQLEAFIDRLAAAEHDAARQIAQAGAESTTRLAALREQLAEDRQTALSALEAEFATEQRRQKSALRRRLQRMEKETEREIEAMRKRHAVIKDALVGWAVKRIIQP